MRSDQTLPLLVAQADAPSALLSNPGSSLCDSTLHHEMPALVILPDVRRERARNKR